jgi:hypothetical protein
MPDSKIKIINKACLLIRTAVKTKNILMDELYFYAQIKILNVITLGQRETDNINRMITLTKEALRIVDNKTSYGLPIISIY